MALALSLPPGVLPGLPKEQLQFTPRSASTPCLLHSPEQHKSRESGGGDALRRGGLSQPLGAGRLHLPGPQPHAADTRLAFGEAGLAFGERSGPTLA